MSFLKQALLDEYYASDNKRIKNFEKMKAILVDDRTDGGIASNGDPFGWFCTILLFVISEYEVQLQLDNVPLGPTVARWVTENNVEPPADNNPTLKFSIKKGEVLKLETLADAIAIIVAPGRRYKTDYYKHSCPRTAASLRRLAKCLANAWADETTPRQATLFT